MAALLGKWLNTSFTLNQHVEQLDQELSTGYILGQVLNEKGIEKEFDQYLEEDSTFAKATNFELLATSLGKIDIKLSVKQAREIMMETPGSATKVT